MLRTLLSLAVVVGLAPTARADDVRAHARRITSPPTIDGHLDEAAWQAAPKQSHFTQRFPKDNVKADAETTFAILYDDSAIYVGVWAADAEPAKIKNLLTRRDVDVLSDLVIIGFDSYRDRRTAFAFQLNAAGVQRDTLIFDDSNQDDTWDAVWTGNSAITTEGWTAEFRIPLNQLRYASDGSHEWGFQILRIVGRTSEQSTWSPWPRSAPEVVSHFGIVDGIDHLKPSRRLELLPYVTGGLDRTPIDAGDPINDHVGAKGNLGIDLKYGLGPAFTLSATINPDFGQVEADPSMINLSANELFFAEKRPFFLEGTDLFRLPIGNGDNVIEGSFYSRRIGAAPADPAASYDYIKKPPSTAIYGAAKLTGKTTGGWSVGVFDAVTGRESATLAGADGTHNVIVAPLSNYAMARVKRDLRAGKTTLAGSLTAVDRALDGTPLAATLHDQAYTGGAQVSHRFASNAWQADLSILGSYVHGSETAIAATQQLQRHLFQRPDATYLTFDPHRTSLSGYDVTASIGQFGDSKHWRFGTGLDLRSPGLELNDMGFQQSSDRIGNFLWMQYRDDEPHDVLLNWQANHDVFYIANFAPELESYGYDCNAHAQFLNYWTLGVGCNLDHVLLDTGALRGGPALAGTTSYAGFANITSDARKAVWATVNGSVTIDPDAHTETGEVDLGATIQARSNLDLYVGPSWSSRHDPLQYVDRVDDAVTGAPHYLFGTIDQTTLSLTMRANWTFSPHLALQVYAQPFIAAGRYSELKDVDHPRARRFDDRFHTFTGSESREADGNIYVDRNHDGVDEITVARPDFNFRQLRSTVVLRWEYRPGSNVFAIWSHGQTSSADSRYMLGHDLAALGRAPSEDIVMIKVNYWIGL